MKHLNLLLLTLANLLLSGCLGMPATVRPITGFELERYLGTWYEIARLDHSFERGLEKVTATYSMRDDGGVRVLNRGWSASNEAWEEAEGKAYFVEDPATGYLKVSFFGPFYGSYVIFDLDKDNYQYAFVSGPDLSYLWLLSRAPNIDPAVMDSFLAQAERHGFDTASLIMVNHE